MINVLIILASLLETYKDFLHSIALSADGAVGFSWYKPKNCVAGSFQSKSNKSLE